MTELAPFTALLTPTVRRESVLIRGYRKVFARVG
jgi:hypothetical protein